MRLSPQTIKLAVLTVVAILFAAPALAQIGVVESGSVPAHGDYTPTTCLPGFTSDQGKWVKTGIEYGCRSQKLRPEPVHSGCANGYDALWGWPQPKVDGPTFLYVCRQH